MDVYRKHIEKLEEEIADGYEALGEWESQYNSEVAMYGDAGPGQYHTIISIKQSIAKLVQQYENAKRNEKWAKLEEIRKAEFDKCYNGDDSF